MGVVFNIQRLALIGCVPFDADMNEPDKRFVLEADVTDAPLTLAAKMQLIADNEPALATLTHGYVTDEFN